MSPHEWNDEHRSALAAETELSRVTGCPHRYNGRGVCVHCGDDEARKDAHA